MAGGIKDYASKGIKWLTSGNLEVNPADFFGNPIIKNNEALCTIAATHAIKTVSNVAAELFAGSSRKSGRKRMRVYNEGSVAIYFGIGDNTITAGTSGTGQPIQPGDYEMFYFDPTVDMSIYCIAASSNTSVKVSEM